MVELANNELLAILPEARDWIYIEPKEDKRPIEERLQYGGKWVIYGSKKYIEKLVRDLKCEVGRNIDAMKYSVKPIKVTPNAPDKKYALLVYCDESRKGKLKNILESKGVKKVTWKSNKESLKELLDDPFFCLILELFNPGRLEYLANSLQIEINPHVLERVKKFKNYIGELLQNFSTKEYTK